MPAVNPKTLISYVMPTPGAIVVWTNAPGGEKNYAIVTGVGRNAISVMVFPTESRVGVPKDAVRHVGDPRNIAQGIASDSGVWDYTSESKQIQALVSAAK